MCLTKVYYNTYSDGTQDITEKDYPCRDGRRCSRPEMRKYDRKFPFSKLGDPQPESHRSLSERKPTPYFSSGSKSPSPSRRRRHSDAYMSGGTSGRPYDYDPYSQFDPYGYHRSSSREDPRDRYEREPRESRSKRSSTMPQIVYMDRDKPSRSRSHSSSRDYSRDIPVGLVPLADEYGRRHSSRSREREREREASRESSDRSSSSKYHRRRTDDPQGYVLFDDQDERRRQRREKRRMSTSSYPEPSSSAAAAMADPYADPHRYLPRRASTVVHHSDGSISASSGGGSAAKPKQLRWEDQVRAKRDRQNAEIASRPGSVEPPTPKSILKHSGGGGGGGDAMGKGKGREMDDIAELRRAVQRMEIPRGRDREPRGGYGRYEEDGDWERRKRSKVWTGDERYGYR